ncbi:molybdopterin oxidoreductase family protein [Caminibacter mediatlanticus]|uniref:Nitrate reductase narB n=1 Tax=Caminibacter mediatlanticus TB-2 TaxID=391592 RepID=A0AAI9AIK4_9BACT|nr:molybdopterin-dependent oxidoreductase [Caminibacter mediatlanticus]EDM24297.1 nitrate reductase narB [Caminibacter mediatlanticus TB-2]
MKKYFVQNGSLQCSYCGVGCNLTVNNSKIRGKKCAKGANLIEPLKHNRLTKPLYRTNKNSKFKEISWDEAYEILINAISKFSEKSYFYISGQLQMEDMYVINKFVKGVIKNNNIDANSRLCVATLGTAQRMAFGVDLTPVTFDDIDESDVVIFWGSNAAINHPILFDKVRKLKKEKHIKIITIDPYETITAKKSDIFIQINAGSDTVLFNYILKKLAKRNFIDQNFINKYTTNFEETLKEAKKYSLNDVKHICGIEKEDINTLIELFASNKKIITIFAMGLNQSMNGTYKTLGLINLHLATKRIGKKGGVLGLTGQPNAYSGRIIGYYPQMLPGFRSITNEKDREFVQNFWNLDINEKPGVSITEAIDEILKDNINFMWIVATNPIVSLPNTTKVNKALKKAFVVVQDIYDNIDTLEYANLVLPSFSNGEKLGHMVNSERRLRVCKKIFSIQNTQAKEDWKIFSEVAQKLGYEKQFNYKNSNEIFNEIKEFLKSTDADLENIKNGEIINKQHPFENEDEYIFRHEDKKAKFIPAIFDVYKPLYELSKKEFILISGRIKHTWNSGTKTNKVKSFKKFYETPICLMNEKDMKKLNLKHNDKLVLKRKGISQVFTVIKSNIRKKHIYIPFGYGRAFVRHYVNSFINDRVDPFSKEPDFKYSIVKVNKKFDFKKFFKKNKNICVKNDI